ncbi:MAG: hypothetical protein J2P18_07170 [Nocardia sp.]|nr:hypothetical protein [Nocardia sp.]
MAFRVDPDGLRAAAGALAQLPTEIDSAPQLAAEPVANVLKGLAVGAELDKSDPASRQAKDVLKARFNEFAAVLELSADSFHGTDLEAAQRLAAIPDLNSGDPHGGK